MKKHWKKLTAVAVAVAVVGCLGVFSSDRQLKATDEDGNAGTEVVTAEVPVEITETPVEEITAVETPTEDIQEVEVPVEDAEAVETPTEDAEEKVDDAEETDEKAEDAEDAEDVETSEDEANVDRSVLVSANVPDGSDVNIGDHIVLTATLNGFDDVAYTVQWQYSADGGNTWNDISGATGLSYEFDITEENAEYCWNVLVSVPD